MRTRILLLAVLTLAGCTMAPRYRRPALPVPDRFPEAAGAQAESTSAAAAALGWREYFPDERLRAVIGAALEGNRDLRIAALNVEASAAIYGIQRNQLAPALGVEATGEKLQTHSQTATQYVVEGGFLSWELDLFGRLRSLKAAALDEYLASAEAQRAVHMSVVAAVASTWFKLAADSECLNLAEATIKAQTTTRDLVKASRDAGVASDLDLSQAESQVEAARVSRAGFAGAVGVDRHTLELLVGSPVPAGLLPEGLSTLAGMPALAEGIPSGVLLARPDILAAEDGLRAANATIGAARAAFFPQITLTAAAGTLAPEVSHLFEAGTGTWRFAPVVQMPIFGGPVRGNLKAAKVEREIAIASYEKAIQAAFAEVADGLTLRSTLLDECDASDHLLKSLEETLRLSEARYQAGLDSYLGVLVAQRSLFSSQQAGVALHFAEKANRVALYKALGGGI